MKKGDIIRKETIHEEGEILYSNCPTKEHATQFMQHEFLQHYRTSAVPAYDIITAEGGGFTVICKASFRTTQDAKVNWVVDKEAAISFVFEPSANFIINIETDGWIVVQESIPSFQSQVATMTDEELKAAIEASRNQRASFQPEKKVRIKLPQEERRAIDPLEAKLASLSPEDRQKLKEKLGLI